MFTGLVLLRLYRHLNWAKTHQHTTRLQFLWLKAAERVRVSQSSFYKRKKAPALTINFFVFMWRHCCVCLPLDVQFPRELCGRVTKQYYSCPDALKSTANRIKTCIVFTCSCFYMCIAEITCSKFYFQAGQMGEQVFQMEGIGKDFTPFFPPVVKLSSLNLIVQIWTKKIK